MLFSISMASTNSAHAFKLDPSSKPDSSGFYKKKFFEPVHENLTVKAVNAANVPDSLKNNPTFLSQIIKGVRWNDDPLSMAKKRPQDFYIYYKDSCGSSEEVGFSKICGAGIINQFGIYTAQGEKSHGHADIHIEDIDEHMELSLTDLSAKLIELVVNQRSSGTDNWAEAEIILEKAFAIRNPSEKPGDIGYGITIRSRGPTEAGR